MSTKIRGGRRASLSARSVAVRAASGFTLLELLVAFSIMALALGMFYRALGGSVRSVDQVQRHQGAVILAQSLLNLRDSVPVGGWNEEGDSAGYHWRVQSQPYSTDVQGPRVPPLYEVSVAIHWGESGGETRKFELTTLRPERNPPLELRP
jgi:general secretion pathway protein I